MNDSDAVLAGRIEDKWIEFVAAEISDRARRGRTAPRRGRGAERMRRVEVHASYVWLLVAALATWFLA